MILPKGGKCRQGRYDQELSGTGLGRARGPSRTHLELKTHTHLDKLAAASQMSKNSQIGHVAIFGIVYA